jgi:hypothetical protein
VITLLGVHYTAKTEPRRLVVEFPWFSEMVGVLPLCSGVSLMFGGSVGGLTTPLWVSLGFANGVDPARTAVVVSLPCCWISPVFGNGGGSLAAPSWGFPRIAKRRVSSEDGGRAHAASAGLRLLWLVFFEGAGSDGGGGYLAASRSASRSQWGW